MDKIVVSIIIVTYNCGLDLLETLQSIEEQIYRNFEVIFIDGLSSDNTMEIIRDYCNNNLRGTYISEKDSGIYDAMNKGIKLSHGDIIYFLNAKDKLYDNNVLQDTVKYFIKDKDIDIVFGDYIQSYDNNRSNIEKKQDFILGSKWRVIWGICHQSMFVRKNVFYKVGLFDTDYRISADNEWLTRCLMKKNKFKHIDRCICYYDMNGFSSNNSNLGVIENIKYSQKLLKGKYKLMYYIKRIYQLWKLKNFDKNIITEEIKNNKFLYMLYNRYIRHILINTVKKRIKGKNNIINYDYSSIFNRVIFDIQGNGNCIFIDDNCVLNNVKFYIRGDSHKIKIGKNVIFSRGAQIWFEDNEGFLDIGEKTTFENIHIAVTENNSKIKIGNDCMFANDIDIRTGDSHSVIDLETKRRTNKAKNVEIGNHNWIASHVSILKGTYIKNNCIVSTRSVLNKKYNLNNILIGGCPGRLLKNKIDWMRKRI